jgi:hypothetical protein
MRRAALCTAAAALVVGAPAPAAHAARVLVAVADGHRPPSGARLVTSLGAARVYALAAPRGVSARAYARLLGGRRWVLAAQADQRAIARPAQPDVFCAPAPGSPDTGIPSATNALGASAPSTPPVAILDTGVDGTVPELAGRLVSPFNALDGSTNVADQDGHGTQVASVAAARPGLFQGVSPTSPIMPIRIFGVGGDTSAQILVKAIQQAVAAGAGVINISGANPLSAVDPGDNAVVALAIDNAYAHGVLTVTAAGNEGVWGPDVPASDPHVIDAGATDASGQRAPFSNTGPWIDEVAPGAALTLPVPAAVCSSGFGVASGTSFSAPAVAAAVALVRQLRPTLTPEQITQLLRASASPIAGPGHDDGTGYGMLDVGAALAGPVPAVDSTELDDDVMWVTGAYASRHPALLRKGRIARVHASVSPAKDPQDVYPVILRKGQTLTVRVTGGADSLLDTGVWDPNTGPMDVSNGRTTHEVSDYAGVSDAPQISYKVKRGGRYFVSVEAQDVPDPPDPGQAPPTVPAAERYLLTVSVKNPPKKHKKRSTHKTTGKKR